MLWIVLQVKIANKTFTVHLVFHICIVPLWLSNTKPLLRWHCSKAVCCNIIAKNEVSTQKTLQPELMLLGWDNDIYCFYCSHRYVFHSYCLLT